ncbi:MAG: LCP family protein [Lachnospiraceae bacterium]|nr:LCP family protein [Lachnospiraceae bacterium]
MGRTKKKGKGRIAARIFFVLGLMLSISFGSFAATVVHRGDSMLALINYDNKNSLSTVDLSQYELDKDTDVINVLLVGADKNNDEQNADVDRRSDSMMIATLDIKHSKLKVTSLMRDMYVEIPGYGKRKLNASYSLGGIKLLYKTIAKNFGISMDGYAEVNFDAFVNVIDEIGGVEATLTESEAKNLNSTNYIKRRKYRKVKVGKQTLNGYQALGYCRIRHGKRQADGTLPGVYTASGKGDDYGRTERQRLTIAAILKKVKTLSVNEWMELVEVVLPNVTTDLSRDQIYSYLMAVVRMGTTELHQFSLPIDGGYSGQTLSTGEQVLVPDLQANKSALKKFIFKS